MGSGRLIMRAIKKHGKENFKKEILYSYTTESEMNQKERELVTEEFCLRKDTYNLCVGGQGGFSYVNRLNLNNQNKNVEEIYKMVSDKLRGRKNPNFSQTLKEKHANGELNHTHFGARSNDHEIRLRAQSSDARKKRKDTFSKINHQQGSNNSQFGKCWITNGIENLKISKFDTIPDGWFKGRTLKPTNLCSVSHGAAKGSHDLEAK